MSALKKHHQQIANKNETIARLQARIAVLKAQAEKPLVTVQDGNWPMRRFVDNGDGLHLFRQTEPDDWPGVMVKPKPKPSDLLIKIKPRFQYQSTRPEEGR